jgi:hypothetical protein
MHVVRRLKAGDSGALGAGFFCLTFFDPNRDTRFARVSYYAIGIGYRNASLRIPPIRRMDSHHQHSWMTMTREHCSLQLKTEASKQCIAEIILSSAKGKKKLLSAG